MEQNSQTGENPTEKKMTVQELSRKIREASLQTPHPQTPSAVLFIGLTKEGKSTLLTLLESPGALEVVLRQRKHAFISKNSKNDQRIGQGFGSHTTRPENYEIFWDLPGIANDTRGSDQDILNAWSIRNLCMHLERIKVVLVVSEESLDDYPKLLEIVKAVIEVFPDLDQNLSSLCMVMTKKKSMTIPDLRDTLKCALEEEKQNLDPKGYKLLEYFSMEGPIASFSRPTSEGFIQLNERQEILTMIEGIYWYEKPKVGLGVSAHSMCILLQLNFVELNDFSRFIRENFGQTLNEYVKKLISLHTGSAESLRMTLDHLIAQVDILYETPLKLQDCLDKLQDLSLQMEEEKLKDFVASKQKSFGFLAQLASDPSLVTAKDVSKSFSFLELISKDLSNLWEKPQIQKKKKRVTLKGKIIRSQDINEALSKFQEISEVDVDSSEVIFLDGNIKFLGGRLSLMSSQVQVVDIVEIDLTGREGPKHKVSKANNGEMSEEYADSKAESGEAGIPGLPGENGGNLEVKTKDFKNSKNLKVNVSGGRGGPGQDGGDGAGGLDGREDPAREKVENRDKTALKSRKKFKCQTVGDVAEKVAKTILTLNTKFSCEYRYFEKGQPGGDPGPGGKGGPGGKPGEVDVDGAPLREILNDNGPLGLDGQPGKAGPGGKDGPEYRGVFIEEQILSGFRGTKSLDAGTVGTAAGAGAQIAGVTAGRELIVNGTVEVVKAGLKIGAKAAKATVATTMGASLAIGVGACLALQSVGSIISASFSDGWSEEPHKVVEDQQRPREDEAIEMQRISDQSGRNENVLVLQIQNKEDAEENETCLSQEDDLNQNLISTADIIDEENLDELRAQLAFVQSKKNE